ncbi:putative 4-hydroxy-4-methyl-2-oxoglutarate aldolase 2 [Lolium rigidum]|uniref:putative 4-hydroxy-4-methyl-2-oxoglutarate aldolase 2 n=1 Tax=Lolium rigidum TaxID=89674 RepID=UPI001F5E1AA1|nr:putative 4-hydroxy-4-methyl-2-oxoglutarate aldolase 2 [Lolium rigidum]
MGAQKLPAAPVADLCDANASLILTGELRILEPVFQDYGQCISFSGQVVTMRVLEHNVGESELLETSGEGRVLVLDGRGSKRCAIMGGNLAEQACRNGWAGAVVNGCIRDVADINSFPIGVRALASHPRHPGTDGVPELHVDVEFAGAVIRDGEWLYADTDGIIVCSKEIYGFPEGARQKTRTHARGIVLLGDEHRRLEAWKVIHRRAEPTSTLMYVAIGIMMVSLWIAVFIFRPDWLDLCLIVVCMLASVVGIFLLLKTEQVEQKRKRLGAKCQVVSDEV